MMRTVGVAVLVCCLLCGGSLGCSVNSPIRSLPSMSAPSLVTRTGSPQALVTVSSIALLPIRFDSKVRSLPEDVRERAERDLASAFAREADIRLISSQDVVKTVPAAQSLDPRSVGQRLQADGVLVTTVHQFVERLGSSYGSERPATVDFSMKVLRSDSGVEVWRASYHYKDEPLSDNLLNLGNRIDSGSVGRFQTAQEIMALGFASAGRDLAEVRQGTFQR